MTGIFPAGILPLGEERVKVGPAVAEFLGVFFLCLAATLAGHHLGGGPAALVGSALVSGVVIAAGIAAFAPTSGAHFNPAVSLSFLLLGRIDAGTFAGYVLAQLGGGLAGAWAAGAVLPAGSVLSGTPMIQPGLSPAAAVLLESAATLLLMIVILGSAVGRRATPQTAPILIGFTITAMILALGPLTGAAMNPARHLGPAIVSGSLDGWWIYWLGPAAGATAGTMLWRFVLEPPSTEDS